MDYLFSGPLIDNFIFPASCPMTMFQTVPDTSSYVKVRQHRPYNKVMLDDNLGHYLLLFFVFH